MRVIITGVQNVVKDSVIRLALERLEGKADFRKLSFSDFADEVSGSAEELEVLRDTQKKIRENLQLKMLSPGGGKNIIVNGYCTVKTSIGFYPVITRETMKVFDPDVIVHLEVSAMSPSAKISNKKKFTEHSAFEKSCSMLLAADAGCGIRLIKSELESSRKASDELYEMLKGTMVSQ